MEVSLYIVIPLRELTYENLLEDARARPLSNNESTL